jgi:hypothetical protein
MPTHTTYTTAANNTVNTHDRFACHLVFAPFFGTIWYYQGNPLITVVNDQDSGAADQARNLSYWQAIKGEEGIVSLVEFWGVISTKCAKKNNKPRDKHQ